MILDKIENASLYNLNKDLQTGIDYLKNTDLSSLAEGVYELQNGILAIVSEYQSKKLALAKPEAHEKMIDIQFLIEGEEFIGYAPLEDQTPSIAYSEEKDVAFYNCETSLNKISKGMFAIYYPSDIHQPGIQVKDPIKIKKVVVKIPV